jgi:hypothetical protein
LRLLSDVARTVASTYKPRQWTVIFIGSSIAIWLYTSSAAIARVHDPPNTEEAPAVDYFVPTYRRFLPGFAAIEVAARGCKNPVRVVVEVKPSHWNWRMRQTQWLKPSSTIGFGVADRSARNLGIFAAYVPDERFLDPSFEGDRNSVEIARWSHSVRSRPGNPRAISSNSEAPTLIGAVPRQVAAHGNYHLFFAFEADWVRPRTHRTCYLWIPALNGNGAVELNPPKGEILYSGDGGDATATLINWRLVSYVASDLGFRLLLRDSSARPNFAQSIHWSCLGSERGTCFGAYVALTESNASGSTSSALFLRGALLGVVAALVAESLLRFRRPRWRFRQRHERHLG